MYFSTVAEFFHMGGHGVYVWMAYGIVSLTLLGLVVQPLLKSKKALLAISQRKINSKHSNNASLVNKS